MNRIIETREDRYDELILAENERDAMRMEFRYVLAVIEGTSGVGCSDQADDIVWDADGLIKLCPDEALPGLLGIKAVAGNLAYRLQMLAERIAPLAQAGVTEGRDALAARGAEGE